MVLLPQRQQASWSRSIELYCISGHAEESVNKLPGPAFLCCTNFLGVEGDRFFSTGVRDFFPRFSLLASSNCDGSRLRSEKRGKKREARSEKSRRFQAVPGGRWGGTVVVVKGSWRRRGGGEGGSSSASRAGSLKLFIVPRPRTSVCNMPNGFV